MENIMEMTEPTPFLGLTVMELTEGTGLFSDDPEEDKCWVDVPEL